MKYFVFFRNLTEKTGDEKGVNIVRVLNIGSLNLDKVYDVTHFAAEGETILCDGYWEFVGGKGLNQSVALAKAGACVYHAGAVGGDGQILLQTLEQQNVHTELAKRVHGSSGHAVIQRSLGHNCIIACGGANALLTIEDIETFLANFDREDMLLLQNETSCVADAMRMAAEKGMKIAFNASPVTEDMLRYPLELVDVFLVNETEAATLAATEKADDTTVLNALANKFPDAAIVMTVGAQGAYYRDRTTTIFCNAYPTTAVDTTGAGDTFTGFFLASLTLDYPVEDAMRRATAAAALSVQRQGACKSIPCADEVERFLRADNTDGGKCNVLQTER